MSQQSEDWLKGSARDSLVKNSDKWQQTDPGIRQKVLAQLKTMPALAALGAPGQQFMSALQQSHEQVYVPLGQCSRQQLEPLLQQVEQYFYQSPQDERLALKVLLNLFASTLFAAP